MLACEKKCPGCAKQVGARCELCNIKSKYGEVRRVSKQFRGGLEPPSFYKLGRKEENLEVRPPTRSRSLSKPSSSSSSTLRLQEYFTSLNSTNNIFVGKVGCGKNLKSENNILTPTKQKLIDKLGLSSAKLRKSWGFH